MEDNLVNIIGGCCGTTPEHIRLIAEAVRHSHVPINTIYMSDQVPVLQLSGLELLEITPETNFVNIGERTNVTGSRKFLRLIESADFETAVEVAREQVEGAQIIDINMDEGLIDGVKAMTTFLNLIAAEPDIARVPVMIDSSERIIEAGLRVAQGKSVVNSITPQRGEEAFVRLALKSETIRCCSCSDGF